MSSSPTKTISSRDPAGSELTRTGLKPCATSCLRADFVEVRLKPDTTYSTHVAQAFRPVVSGTPLEHESERVDRPVVGADMHLTVAGPQISRRNMGCDRLAAVPQLAPSSSVEGMEHRGSLRSSARGRKHNIVDHDRCSR